MSTSDLAIPFLGHRFNISINQKFKLIHKSQQSAAQKSDGQKLT